MFFKLLIMNKIKIKISSKTTSRALRISRQWLYKNQCQQWGALYFSYFFLVMKLNDKSQTKIVIFSSVNINHTDQISFTYCQQITLYRICSVSSLCEFISLSCDYMCFRSFHYDTRCSLADLPLDNYYLY